MAEALVRGREVDAQALPRDQRAQPALFRLAQCLLERVLPERQVEGGVRLLRLRRRQPPPAVVLPLRAAAVLAHHVVRVATPTKGHPPRVVAGDDLSGLQRGAAGRAPLQLVHGRDVEHLCRAAELHHDGREAEAPPREQVHVAGRTIPNKP